MSIVAGTATIDMQAAEDSNSKMKTPAKSYRLAVP